MYQSYPAVLRACTALVKQSLLLLVLLRSFSLSAQNYVNYQSTFNRTDEDLLAGDYPTAIRRLDSVYAQYPFIYARHCMKALQVMCMAKDSLRADQWLSKCFVQGIPLWVIRANDLTKAVLSYSTAQKTILAYDSLRALYQSHIHPTLARQIDSLLVIDQKHTKRVNDGFIPFRYTVYYSRWVKNNKRQFNFINHIIDSIGFFPGERLIGLPGYYADSAKACAQLTFWGPYLMDTRAYTMLIHYFSNPRRDINDKLFKSVQNGYLPASQFGGLNDFLALWGKGKYEKYPYYNVWHQDPVPTNGPVIETLRARIGLNTFEQQKRNMLLNRERRKNKTANLSVITE